jgi:F-type H+-transporting ATPase subunit c
MTPEIMHYLAASIAIMLGAVGAGIGLGIATSGTEGSMTRQTAGNLPMFRAMFIGLMLIESGAIVALVISLFTLFTGYKDITWEVARVELSIGLAVGIAAASISIASSFVVRAATQAIARQPFFANKIMTFMLIAQSIIEAPAIFAFIVALLIRAQLTPTISGDTSLTLFAAGMTIALGCIGPSIGQSLLAYAACTSVGLNKNAYGKIFPFTLLNQAIVETPMIFCVLLSLLIVYTHPESTKALIAALTLGASATGSALSIGYVASRGCRQIAADQTLYAAILRPSILTVALIESSVIYALIISLLLITMK